MPLPANKARAVAVFSVRSYAPTRPFARSAVSLLGVLARPVLSPECRLRDRENQSARAESTRRISLHRLRVPRPVAVATTLPLQYIRSRKRWYADGKVSEP